jgi:hypothetical protein
VFDIISGISHWFQKAYGMAIATIVGGEVAVLTGIISLRQLPDAAHRIASIDVLVGLLLSTVIIGVGAWGINQFTKFKDEATHQAATDREAATKALTEAKAQFMEAVHELKSKVERVDAALTGFDGDGGVLGEVRKLGTQIEMQNKERAQLLDYILRERGH